MSDEGLMHRNLLMMTGYKTALVNNRRSDRRSYRQTDRQTCCDVPVGKSAVYQRRENVSEDVCCLSVTEHATTLVLHTDQ